MKASMAVNDLSVVSHGKLSQRNFPRGPKLPESRQDPLQKSKTKLQGLLLLSSSRSKFGIRDWKRVWAISDPSCSVPPWGASVQDPPHLPDEPENILKTCLQTSCEFHSFIFKTGTCLCNYCLKEKRFFCSYRRNVSISYSKGVGPRLRLTKVIPLEKN